MEIQEFFDKATSTLTYVLFDGKTRDAIVIDPVMDYEPAASTISERSANEVINYIKGKELNLLYILETHAHADHLSGSQILKRAFPKAKIGIGTRIREVQKLFKGLYNLTESFKTDGSQFDQLFEDGEILKFGTFEIKTINTPGHTPACVSYLVNGDSLFVGDALFMPDSGTGRCDFPAGSASDLYDSISAKIYGLNESIKVYVGHDYQPNGRELRFQTTVGNSKTENIQLTTSTSKGAYVKFRTERDRGLTAPKLLLPSLQVNIRAGQLPEPEDNGIRYLKIPVR